LRASRLISVCIHGRPLRLMCHWRRLPASFQEEKPYTVGAFGSPARRIGIGRFFRGRESVFVVNNDPFLLRHELAIPR